VKRRPQAEPAEADPPGGRQRRLQNRKGLAASFAGHDVVGLREGRRVELVRPHELQNLEDPGLDLLAGGLARRVHFLLLDERPPAGETSWPRTISSSGTGRPSRLQNLRYWIGALSFLWRR